MVGQVRQVGQHRRKPRVFVSYLAAEVGHPALPPLADRVAFGRFVLGIPILLTIAPQMIEGLPKIFGEPPPPVAATEGDDRPKAGADLPLPASRRMPAAARGTTGGRFAVKVCQGRAGDRGGA